MVATPIVTMFSALADETRLDIVTRLAHGEATMSELAAHYDMSVQAVSKHLSVLERAGLVSRRREAQRKPVRLEVGALDLMTAWIERYRQDVEASYRRLDRLLTRLDDHTEGETR